ncbi:MAG: class I SAM-dependent methyltransferase [Burkholderiales bacterium]|nr:class I SAM-dependent methyltransferase [Burkholderiales bacterium]
MQPRKNFDLESILWDADNTRVRLATRVAQAMLDAGISQEAEALDFGCGTGLLTLALQPHVRSIAGVDSSAGMLEQLKEKISANRLENVSASFVDFENGRHIEGNYDLVVSSMTAHHIPDTLALLREWHRVLRPGGMLCFADLDSEDGSFHGDNTGVFHLGFDREKLKALCAQAGFCEIRDSTATTVVKEVRGERREFPIFLICAKKA